MNTIIYSLLGGIIASLLSGIGGYYVGNSHGNETGRNAAAVTSLTKETEQQAKALQSFIDTAEQHKALIDESNTASRKLRAVNAQRTRSNAREIKELKNELAQTKADRTHCQLPTGVVRRTQDARANAIRAATGGSATASDTR